MYVNTTDSLLDATFWAIMPVESLGMIKNLKSYTEKFWILNMLIIY